MGTDEQWRFRGGLSRFYSSLSNRWVEVRRTRCPPPPPVPTHLPLCAVLPFPLLHANFFSPVGTRPLSTPLQPHKNTHACRESTVGSVLIQTFMLGALLYFVLHCTFYMRTSDTEHLTVFKRREYSHVLCYINEPQGSSPLQQNPRWIMF
jgi:hypothetical protein